MFSQTHSCETLSPDPAVRLLLFPYPAAVTELPIAGNHSSEPINRFPQTPRLLPPAESKEIMRNFEIVLRVSALRISTLAWTVKSADAISQDLVAFFVHRLKEKKALRKEETVSKEKIWQLILQNEPSVIPISLASKLSADDLLACIYLVEVLIVDYPQRLLEIFPTKAFLQLMLFLLCHPNWITRKSAHDIYYEKDSCCFSSAV